MSVASEILAALETKVADLFPTFKKAKFSYEIEKNNRKNSTKIFAVKPLGGNSTSGMTLSATFSQDFAVVLSDIYNPKNDTDSQITTVILDLQDKIQDLNKDILQKRLDLTSAKVLLVQLVGISEPEIDLENNSVTITATFTINYRVML
jgi:hypothetical protein